MPSRPLGRVNFGCSTFIGFFLLAGVAFMAFGWPRYIDRNGTAASGVIQEKRESIRIWYAEWYRRFEIIAAYSAAGQPMTRHAICDVDEKTFDSLRVGDRVPVHYFPALLVQPLIAADHLEPCSPFVISWRSDLVQRLSVAIVPLLALFFAWRFLRIRLAGWLLLPWLFFALYYLVVPRLEPEPAQPVAATAQVDFVNEVTKIHFGRRRRSDIELFHPYEIVRLRFAAPGKNTPVTAVDKVDKGSVPNLAKGQTVPIVYDAGNPRIVRLQQGTREFSRQAGGEVILLGAVMLGLVLLAAGIGRLLRRAAGPTRSIS